MAQVDGNQYTKFLKNSSDYYTLTYIAVNSQCKLYGKKGYVTISSCPPDTGKESVSLCRKIQEDLPPVWFLKGQIWILFSNTSELFAWTPLLNCTGVKANQFSSVTSENCTKVFSPLSLPKIRTCAGATPISIPNCQFCEAAQKFELAVKHYCDGPATAPDRITVVLINGQSFKSSDICKEDEMFDVIFSRCCQISCPTGQYVKFGECHKYTTVYIGASELPLPSGAKNVSVNIKQTIHDFTNFITTTELVNQLLSKISSTLVSKELREASLKVNLTNIYFEEIFDILGSIKYRKRFADVELRIRSYENKRSVELSCGHQKYLCFYKAAVSFKGENMFAHLNYNDIEFFLSMSHTFFNMSILNDPQPIVLNDICVCQSSFSPYLSSSSQNCSFTWYNYKKEEYVIFDGKVLEILNTGLRFDASEYQMSDNFSVLICFDPSKVTSFLDMNPVQQYTSWIFSGISVIFLVVTIILNIRMKEIQKLPTKLTTCLAVSLAIGQCLLILPKVGKDMCRYAAAQTHVRWLSAFMWMSAQAVHMFLTFHPSTLAVSSKCEASKTFRIYCTICLGVPTLIVIPGLILDFIPGHHVRLGYGVTSCGWISNTKASFVTFFVPVGISLLINITCFGMTLYYIQKALSGLVKINSQKRDRNMCLIYLKLSSVLGFSWVLGFIAAFAKVQVIWYVYIVLNGLKGVFVFLSFTVSMTKRRFSKSIVSVKSVRTE